MLPLDPPAVGPHASVRSPETPFGSGGPQGPRDLRKTMGPGSRRLQVDAAHLHRLEEHARAAYPNECCGFLLATPVGREGPMRVLLGVEPARNRSVNEPRARFVISAQDLREAEGRAEGTGRKIVGFYHSHPDRTVLPSDLDRQNAWPWYSYLITALTASELGPTEGFELDSERREFDRVDLRIRGADAQERDTETLRGELPQ